MVDPEALKTVTDCLERIRQLEEENAHLREASRTFGDLAERLKRALDAEGGLNATAQRSTRRDR